MNRDKRLKVGMWVIQLLGRTCDSEREAISVVFGVLASCVAESGLDADEVGEALAKEAKRLRGIDSFTPDVAEC